MYVISESSLECLLLIRYIYGGETKGCVYLYILNMSAWINPSTIFHHVYHFTRNRYQTL